MVFDYKHFKTLSKDEKIQYLNNYEEEIIDLHITEYSDIIHILHEMPYHQLCIDDDYVMAHANKKFTCNGQDVLDALCYNFDETTKLTYIIKKVIELYIEKGWISKENHTDLIYKIFTCNKQKFPNKFLVEDISLYDYIIDLYDKLEIPLNEIPNNTGIYAENDLLCSIARYGLSKNFIKILELYIKRNFLVDKNILNIYSERRFHNDYDANNITIIIELCKQNNINLLDNLFLTNVVKYCDDWNTVKHLIEIFLLNNVDIHNNNDLIVHIGKKFNLEHWVF